MVTDNAMSAERKPVFDRIPQDAKLMAAMMPKGAAELLLKFGRSDLSGILPESVTFLQENALIEHTQSLNGNWAWIVTPEGKQVRKALERNAIGKAKEE